MGKEDMKWGQKMTILIAEIVYCHYWHSVKVRVYIGFGETQLLKKWPKQFGFRVPSSSLSFPSSSTSSMKYSPGTWCSSLWNFPLPTVTRRGLKRCHCCNYFNTLIYLALLQVCVISLMPIIITMIMTMIRRLSPVREVGRGVSRKKWINKSSR